MREKLISRALESAAKFLGTNYSQEKRDNIWPGGSMDCSSYTAAIWSSAGFPLLDTSGNELRTSTYQVNAVGFDLIYPESRTMIGKNLPSPKGLLSSYGAQPGDIVFWCFNQSTTRKNKITHVGSIDADGKQIIHTANNKEKCCRKPLSYGDTSICAIIRLQNDVTCPALPEISKPVSGSSRPDEWQVRMMQIALNLKCGEKLTMDGLFGSKCEAAIKKLNATLGLSTATCTYKTWEALGYADNLHDIEPMPTPERVLKYENPMMRGDDVRALQNTLLNLGYSSLGTADGIYGEKTDAALCLFQDRAYRLNYGLCDAAMNELLGL